MSVRKKYEELKQDIMDGVRELILSTSDKYVDMTRGNRIVLDMLDDQLSEKIGNVFINEFGKITITSSIFDEEELYDYSTDFTIEQMMTIYDEVEKRTFV